MEQTCRRNLKREEETNQIGCMWMFISIFGSNQKRLLMDKKHGSRRLSVNKQEQPSCSCEETEICKNSVDESEEKFREIIKRLIDKKEGQIQTCKDLLEAFHVLSSEEESCHEEGQSLEEDSNEEKLEVALKQEAVIVVPERKCRFFSRRKWRSTKTIMVLKTGLDEDSSSTGNKSKTRRTFSRFLSGLIKKRLQSAVGKKSLNVLDDRRQVGEQVLGERIRCPDEEDTIQRSNDSEKIMSGLYIAAKKHLSEMRANGDIDVNLPDKEVPRILWKILSLPEFASPDDSLRVIPAANGLRSPLNETTEKPKILQCSSGTDDPTDEDSEETLSAIDISVPRGENVDKEEKCETDPLSDTCSSPVSREVEYVDEDVLEFCEADEDDQKEMINQAHSPSSPPGSPPSSSVRMVQCKETAIDVQGKLSPVSVLEPQFTDDESSPISTRFSSVEMRIQPLCIRFDEADSPKQDKGNNLKASMDDKELILTFIEAVVRSSGLSWEELLKRPFYSEQLLEPADDIVFSSTELCDDKKLLYDCINEVLIDFCRNELNPGPRISFLRPEIQLISDKETAVKMAQEGVYWHLLPLPSPHTLDQIVRKDMAKPGSWMDLRFNIGCIGSTTSEMILDDLVEEIIRSCRGMVQAEPMQDQNSNNM